MSRPAEPVDPARAAAWEAGLRAIAARDDDLAVVPVFLALDDVGAAAEPQAPPAEARRAHAGLAADYLRLALAGRTQATHDDVALVLHVLGEQHLAPGGEVP